MDDYTLDQWYALCGSPEFCRIFQEGSEEEAKAVADRFLPSRNILTIHIGKDKVSIEQAFYQTDEHARFSYRIRLENGGTYNGSAFLKGKEFTLPCVMRSLLGLLSKCGDAYGFTERTGFELADMGIIQRPIAEWAYRHGDEIVIAEQELKGI